jgi:tripartite-type tricarboxylate transporter receptor subunit TctC
MPPIDATGTAQQDARGSNMAALQADVTAIGLTKMLKQALLIILVACAAPACAADYPVRPVSFIVPYAAGGATDLMARLIGQRLEQRLGKPFVIENRPGAGTVLAAAYVAKQPGDGYTLLLGTSTTMAINVTIYKSLPYDPTRDLVPVASVAGVPFILVVNPSLPANSLADLIAYAKANPQALTYASNGHGGAAHLLGELLKSVTGIAATHVPYKGLAPALNDVVAGHVSLMFGDFGTTLPLVRTGKLRALGVSTAQRVGAAPEIPALSEVGLPGFDASSWQMVVAPAGMPRDILGKLNAELRAIVSEQRFGEELSAKGMVPLVTPSPEELQAYVKSEIVRWADVVRQAGAAASE